MSEWLKLTDQQRKDILTQANQQSGIAAKAIEKDWWVTMALKALFTTSCATHLVFKGGTSLSKGWKIIERFSEDIDLAIDRKFLGFDGKLTKKQIKKLRKASSEYICDKLKPELSECLNNMGVDFLSIEIPESDISTNDPQNIELYYNSIFADEYIKDKVLIEIGSRSLMEPSENIPIQSIIAEMHPAMDFADATFEVPTVLASRTFLEKAFLLHEEFQKPIESIRSERMTRHLYDLEKLMDTNFGINALKDELLYQSIVTHRSKLTAISEIDYATHHPGTIDFVPPKEVIKIWEKDYNIMQESMIYGKSLPFGKLIERLEELRERYRKVIH